MWGRGGRSRNTLYHGVSLTVVVVLEVILCCAGNPSGHLPSKPQIICPENKMKPLPLETKHILEGVVRTLASAYQALWISWALCLSAGGWLSDRQGAAAAAALTH